MDTATRTAILTRRLTYVARADDPPPALPDALARLDPIELELRLIQAALTLLGVPQYELARRLGLSDAGLSMKLNRRLPTTETERHIMAYALHEPDRAAIADIQERLRGHDTLEGIDLATLAPVEDAGTGGR